MHHKTEASRVAADIQAKRGEPKPLLVMSQFLAMIYEHDGIEGIAAYFFEQEGDCVYLEEGGEMKSFFAHNGVVVTSRSLN